MRQALPHLFRDKRHYGMKDSYCLLQCLIKDDLGLLVVLRKFGEFQVPVTKIVPEKLINYLGGVIDTEAVQVAVYVLKGLIEFG